jgi:hypothetical protein
MSRIVNVTYHQEPEGWWAESIDAPSFFATGVTRAEVRRRVAENLPRVLGINPDEIERLVVAEISNSGIRAIPADQRGERSSVLEGFSLSWDTATAGPNPESA